TTPWTLPGNLAVAVGPDIGYAAVGFDGERYWMAEARAGRYWDDPSVEQRATGSDLIGTRYEPVFDYFAGLDAQGAFRVIASPDVVVGEGTGLVHMAPAHGEEDFAAAQASGLDLVIDPTDEEGRFTDEVPDVAGMNIKDADPILVDLLRDRGNLVRYQRIRHSYPFCPRTHTPLMYKPISTWFVRVEALRDRMIELNRSIHWVPDHVGSRRFHNWLEGARDWAVSRNRYWGTTIPVWGCDSCEEQVAVGSLDELERLSGTRPNDLHKHVVDAIGFPCSSCEGTMARTPEVLDTWFDAGSMPYAQIHYPFENRERFARRFPADFIAEGLDQTRGWFYTLLILSTALFDERAFQNCVVNGLILAEDGRKLSKRLRNYPDPRHILDEYGADALRIYLFDSPVLRAEPLRFVEQGVRSVVRSTLLPLWNAYSFFSTYAAADGITGEDLNGAPPAGDRPELDRWILSVLQSLIGHVNDLMQGYYLYAVVPPMVRFIDDLTNWYIRRSRRRFWRSRSEDDTDKLAAFATLHEVLVTFSKVIAPLAPFLSEHLYQSLVVAHDQGSVPGSVHLCDYPESKDELVDLPLEGAMSHVQSVVRLGHSLRKKAAIRVRQPVRLVTIVTRDREASAAVSDHIDLIGEELNAREVAISNDESAFVDLSAKANFKLLGPRLGSGVGPVAKAIQDLDQGAIWALIEGGSIDLDDHIISPDDVVIGRSPKSGMTVASEGALSVVLDTAITD
ncbi:MAG TPA: class I tRNA ligase family protein, partial [Acidimicrobiia bacterium]